MEKLIISSSMSLCIGVIPKKETKAQSKSEKNKSSKSNNKKK